MLFSATHILNYRYDNPVSLNPQTIRLKPQTYGTQQLLKFAIEIIPTPAGITECRDLDGNMEHVAWFNGKTDFFKLIVSTKVVTFSATPFAFLPEQEAARLPLNTDEVYRPSVKPYLPDTITQDVIDFSNQISDEANRETLTFLQLLTKRLHTSCVTIRRGEGPPYEPSKTLNERRGANRDLAWLFITCCRSQGIGARFINGYQEGEPENEHSLHAWAEVYLPGAGWRGYDPSLGVLVADRHVALAAGPRADSAAPVSGTFHGEAKAIIVSKLDLSVTAS